MENLPINIVYIGSSAIGLRELFDNSCFSIAAVLCLESRLNKDLYEQAAAYGYGIKSFKWIREFREIINSYPQQTPFFIYQLDMLVPPDLTDKYSFYNIHRGNLYTNRGPCPDIWSILDGDLNASLSLHKINSKIDSGIFIDSYDVEIDKKDDTVSLRIKLENGLPNLIQSLKKYLEFKIDGIVLKNGIYKPWITEANFTIDIENDTIDLIDRKIKSQMQYNGAILFLGGEKNYIWEVLNCENIDKDISKIEVFGYDILKVSAGGRLITFKLNNSPKYHPPPLRPFPVRL